MQVGDRVRVVRDSAEYEAIEAGRTGVVVHVSKVSHSTMNGGGFDVRVLLDQPISDEAHTRRAQAMRELGIGQEYIDSIRNYATLRSTALAVL